MEDSAIPAARRKQWVSSMPGDHGETMRQRLLAMPATPSTSVTSSGLTAHSPPAGQVSAQSPPRAPHLPALAPESCTSTRSATAAASPCTAGERHLLAHHADHDTAATPDQHSDPTKQSWFISFPVPSAPTQAPHHNAPQHIPHTRQTSLTSRNIPDKVTTREPTKPLRASKPSQAPTSHPKLPKGPHPPSHARASAPVRAHTPVPAPVHPHTATPAPHSQSAAPASAATPAAPPAHSSPGSAQMPHGVAHQAGTTTQLTATTTAPDNIHSLPCSQQDHGGLPPLELPSSSPLQSPQLTQLTQLTSSHGPDVPLHAHHQVLAWLQHWISIPPFTACDMHGGDGPTHSVASPACTPQAQQMHQQLMAVRTAAAAEALKHVRRMADAQGMLNMLATTHNTHGADSQPRPASPTATQHPVPDALPLPSPPALPPVLLIPRPTSSHTARVVAVGCGDTSAGVGGLINRSPAQGDSQPSPLQTQDMNCSNASNTAPQHKSGRSRKQSVYHNPFFGNLGSGEDEEEAGMENDVGMAVSACLGLPSPVQSVPEVLCNTHHSYRLRRLSTAAVPCMPVVQTMREPRP